MLDRGRIIPPLIALAAGAGALFVPLLRDLHVESASLASAAGCILGAWHFSGRQETKIWSALGRILTWLGLSALPLLVFALANNCISPDGILFWLVYPVTGTLFGAAAGAFVREATPYPRAAVIVLLLWVGLGVWLVEFFTLPQVRFYNHVWGHFPGPVYDEEARFTKADVYFRGMTLLWAAMLGLWAVRRKYAWAPWLVLASGALLFALYGGLAQQGIVSTRGHIQQTLGGKYETEHFVLYYDTLGYSEDEVIKWGRLHESYRTHVLGELGLDPDLAMLRTESYLYRHVWQKKALTGAKYTSYVPVWNSVDQTHIAKEALEGTLHHELVHVAAKSFGNWPIHASWSFGLVEGLAVAVVPDVSAASTIDQLVAAGRRPTAEELENALSFKGFYTGRGGVNYTTAGSFVRFLMQRYPVENIREAYKKGSFEAYEQSFDTLFTQWERYIGEEKIDSTDRSVAGRVFGRLSLFEMDCPRRVTTTYHYYDLALKAQQEKDTLAAAGFFQKAYAASGGQERLWELLAIQWLMAGRPEQVLAMDGDSVTFAPFKQFYRGEAMFLTGDTVGASGMVLELLADSSASAWHAAVERRTDFHRWNQILALNYRSPEQWPDPRTLDSALVGVWIRRNGMIPQTAIPPVDSAWVRPGTRTFTELETLMMALISAGRAEEAAGLRPAAAEKATRLREGERLELLDYLLGRGAGLRP